MKVVNRKQTRIFWNKSCTSMILIRCKNTIVNNLAFNRLKIQRIFRERRLTQDKSRIDLQK